MARKVGLPVIVALLAGAMLAGCGNQDVADRARQQIATARNELENAGSLGVSVPEDERQLIAEAQGRLGSDPVEALVMATEAKADIQNDVEDQFALAEQTYDVSRGNAEGVIAAAPAGTDVAGANQSLQTAAARKSAAKTIPDWYNPTSGPIYWANRAAQQAAAAVTARVSSQQTAAALFKAVEQASGQLNSLMRSYLSSHGQNPADYKLGIQKFSTSDINWATGAATPLTPVPGSQPISFLFHYENGAWVLKAAPTWTAGQFGAPADMVP
ncbi:MAG: hypothetical protein KKF41_10370 [Actinobacteria bacterium]|nr:hypothetical protein [Actinomycetota bacterium]MBU1943075.1 hypothetical protein [Actinomycetota bacterium]MBU2687978.1 hypothetical protein [Actinomycetota bacterium]